MPATVGKLIQRLRHFLANDAAAAQGDAHLLQRFSANRDETAMAELIARHGLLVFGVCQRVLQNSHDAEDAFQAVFLVLARRAAAIRKPASLASWLFGVALRLAMKMKADASKRRQHENSVPVAPSTPPDDLAWRELQSALDQELGRLPERQRLPLLLCYLEGLSQEEAAARLGWPRGTLKRRLECGRDALRQRLTRRGLTLAGGLLAVLPAQESLAAGLSAAVRAGLPRAAALFAARHQPTAGLVADRAPALAEGMLKAMTASRVKSLSLLLALSTAVLATAGLVGYSLIAGNIAGEPPPLAPLVGKQPEANAVDGGALQGQNPRPDRHADPLPPLALAQLGTTRFRHAGLAQFAYSADGKTLYTAGNDQTIRSFDVASGKQTHHFSYKEQFATFADDGKRVALFTRAGAIRICDAATGHELAQLQAHPLPDQAWIRSPVLLLPDQKTVVTAELPAGMTGIGNGLQYFFDLATGKETAKIGDKSGSSGNPLMPGGAISPDGSLLATIGMSRFQIVLWNTRTGKVAQTLTLPAYATDVAFSADGKMLAAGHANAPEVTLFEVKTGKERVRLQLPAVGSIVRVAFAPPGDRLAAVAEDGRILIWSFTLKKVEYTFPSQPMTWHPPAQGPVFSPDGQRLAASDGNSTVFWDLKTGDAVAAPQTGHAFPVVDAFLTPDGKTAITRDSKTVRFWDVASGKETRLLEEPTLQMGLSRDGKHLVSLGASTYTGRILGAADSNLRATVYYGPLKVWDLPAAVKPREIDLGKFCRQVVFGPDLSTLAVADWNYRVELWDVPTCQRMQQWQESEAGQLYFAPDGKWLASMASYRGMWLLKPGQGFPTDFPADTSGSTVWFSPDARTLGVWGQGDVFLLYDVARGKLQTKVKGLQRQTYAPYLANIAFLPDNESLIYHQQNSLTIRDIATGKEKHKLQGIAGPWVVLPGGKTVAAVLDDGKTIGLFDLPHGKELQRLTGHRARIRCLSFDAAGQRLISGSEDCTALLWDLKNIGAAR